MTRDCPQCGSSGPAPVATLTAARIVGGNRTYRDAALAILGLDGATPFPIVRCTRCGFVFAGELPEPEFLARLYGEVIDPAHADYTSLTPAWIAHQLELAAQLVARAAAKGEVRVLDYGCGDGSVVAALHAAGIRCSGYEPHARSLNAGAEPHVFTTEAAAAASAPFTAVLLSDVLEHVPDPHAVLRRCFEWLVPGGWIAVNVPDFGEPRFSRIVADLRAGRDVPRDLNPWEHLNYFSPASLAAMLESEAFRVDPEPVPRFGLRTDARGARRVSNVIRSLARMLRFAAAPAQATTTIFGQRS